MAKVNVRLARDANGFVEHRCPECAGTFKVKDAAPKVTCPRCGHSAGFVVFATDAQKARMIEALESALLARRAVER